MDSRQAQQRRVLIVLVCAQVLSGAGLAAGITVAALLAQDMLDSTSLAGIASALFTAGSAASALMVGRLSQRFGRRVGLTFGYGLGAIGSAGVVAAAMVDSVGLLLLAFVVYGAGMATNLQARYAGADLAEPGRQGRAVSTVLVATTIGAVVGPNTVAVTGRLAEQWGMPPLSGLFVLAAVAYALAAIVLWVFLRPDPLLLAQEFARAEADPGVVAPVRRTWTAPVLAGAAIMVVTQLVMVAIMTMTPVHMQDHGHSLSAAGVVIAIHVAAMYLPSPLSGFLVDRYGPRVVAAAAGSTLLGAGVLAALAPAHSLPGLALALALLGLGWNLGLLSGTAMLTEALPIATRARTQGTVDLSIALAGAAGGLGSGVVVAAASYPVLGWFGAVAALAIIPAVAVRERRTAARV